jgi:hypothetical protein
MSEPLAPGSTPEIQKLRLWNFPITLRNWLALKFPLGMPDGERDGIDVPVELRGELNVHGWPEIRTDRVKWAEVMRDFAISRNTARRWVRVGIMPGVETPKGIIIPRVLYDAWYAWIREESARRPDG